jgi:hypothetical protein
MGHDFSPTRSEPGRAFLRLQSFGKKETSMREKSLWNESLALAYLVLFALIGCTQLLVSPPVVSMRHDMDNVVNSKGMPWNINESYFGGTKHTVMLYRDSVYSFQTNEAKSYSVLTSEQTTSFSELLPQSPLPLWFRTKYPNLNWKGVPVK